MLRWDVYVWTIVVWERCRTEKVGGVDILCMSSLGGAEEDYLVLRGCAMWEWQAQGVDGL